MLAPTTTACAPIFLISHPLHRDAGTPAGRDPVSGGTACRSTCATSAPLPISRMPRAPWPVGRHAQEPVVVAHHRLSATTLSADDRAWLRPGTGSVSLTASM